MLQSQFDGQCAFDDVNVGTVSSSLLKKQDFGDLSTEQISELEEFEQRNALLESVQSCEEDQFQSDWKESLQTMLTHETLIMKSSSIIDQ